MSRRSGDYRNEAAEKGKFGLTFRGRVAQVTDVSDSHRYRGNIDLKLWEITNGVSQTVEARGSIQAL